MYAKPQIGGFCVFLRKAREKGTKLYPHIIKGQEFSRHLLFGPLWLLSTTNLGTYLSFIQGSNTEVTTKKI